MTWEAKPEPASTRPPLAARGAGSQHCSNLRVLPQASPKSVCRLCNSHSAMKLAIRSVIWLWLLSLTPCAASHAPAGAKPAGSAGDEAASNKSPASFKAAAAATNVFRRLAAVCGGATVRSKMAAATAHCASRGNAAPMLKVRTNFSGWGKTDLTAGTALWISRRAQHARETSSAFAGSLPHALLPPASQPMSAKSEFRKGFGICTETTPLSSLPFEAPTCTLPVPVLPGPALPAKLPSPKATEMRVEASGPGAWIALTRDEDNDGQTNACAKGSTNSLCVEKARAQVAAARTARARGGGPSAAAAGRERRGC
mmetsp:Transcript_68231/g.195757  ORF Transcript_68231/g.195757 Transcript_68231/m.195757 type:complete len:313 (-) Transcript_68231:235-1173(-)